NDGAPLYRLSSTMPLARASCTLLAALALVACAPEGIAASPADYSKGRLWRIAKPGVPDSFVFGTIHVADARAASIPEPVAKAMAKGRLLAMEIAPAEAAANMYGDLELLDDGARLEPL